MQDVAKNLGMGIVLTAATVGAFWLLAGAGVIGRDWWVALAMIVLALGATVLLFMVGGGGRPRGFSGFSDPHDVYIETSAREVSPHSSAVHRPGQRDRYQIRFPWAAIPPGFTTLVLLFFV